MAVLREAEAVPRRATSSRRRRLLTVLCYRCKAVELATAVLCDECLRREEADHGR